MYPKMSKTWLSMLALLGFALVSSGAFAQGMGNIVGTITDPTGAVVPNAKVTVTNEDNGFVRTVTTNSTGNFSAPNLPNGRYEVSVEVSGFNTYDRKDIVLNVDQTVREDAKLQVGNVGQSITVETGQLQVQSDTSDVSQTITSNQLSNISTNGRNVLQLTTLVPGAASQMPDFDSPAAQFQNRSIEFNGMRSDANNWLIDGGEAYDRGGGGILLVAPSQDALEQFTITTSNYAADLGNSSGGMISMAVKSGTRQFHGGAWEYNRNDAADAWSYFLKQTKLVNPSTRKAELRYNVFGFNIGGPVEFRSKDPKTFFFYNQEWRREINGGAIHNLVPTRAMFGFGSSGTTVTTNPDMTGEGTIYVPQTSDPAQLAKFQALGLTPGQPFPNNQIPLSLVDANAKAYLAAGYMLPPNDASGQYYNSAANTTTNFREEIARVDHQFSQKLTVFGHLIYDSSTQAAPIVAWTGNTYPTIGSLETVPSWQAVVHATYQIRPNLLNEASYNLNGNNILITNTNQWHTPAGFTTTPLFNSNTINKVPGIDLSGGSIGVNMDNGNWPWTNTWRSNSYKDDISWVRGTHNFKFGAMWLHTHKNQQIFTDTAGTYRFNGNATGCSGPPNCTKSTNGVGLADFLLGYANNFQQAQTQDSVSISFNNIDAYAMDNWRVGHRLTLNLGVRWEALPHAYDTNNRLSNFYPSLWNPANAAHFTNSTNGILDVNGPGFTTVSGIALSGVPFYLNGVGLAGRNGIPQGLTDNHYLNFAPRIGFAYDTYGDGKTIVRGGFGMFYERNAGNEEYNMGANVPFSNSSSTSFVYTANPAISYVNGQNAGTAPPTPQSFTGVQKNLPISTVYQYNLGIQQQLQRSVVFTLAYVGNRSAHLSQTVDINTLPYNDIADRIKVCGSACGGPSGVNSNYYRKYVGFGSINLVEDEGNAHYDGLQTSLRAAAWKNLTFGVAYTWSHAWDVIDAQLFNNLQNPEDPGYQYGTAGFDRRHIANVNFNYLLPIFQHSGLVTRSLLGGWTVAGIVSMQSGAPLQINAGTNTLGLSGSTTDRADQVKPVTYPHTIQRWFDPTAFAQPAPLTFGNSPKAAVVGPGQQNWNLSLYKDFHFTERVGFKLQADAFNAWNHTRWTGVDTGVLDNLGNIRKTAGTLNATADPRVFQLGARLHF